MADNRGRARERLIENIHQREGALEPALRRAIYARAGELGEPKANDEVPEALRAYVDKVARHAYKVTDEDIAALREQYSTRQVYELTIAAAVGAAASRRDAMLELVRGGRR